MKILNLIKKINDGNETNIYVSTYKIAKHVEDAEQAFRNAINEFLATDKGAIAIKDTYNDFNWGDVDIYIPEEILNKHGIYSTQCEDAINLEVNHDEILCKDFV